MSMVPPSESNDLHLMLALRDGDEAAVESLLRIHGGKVQGYLRRRFPTFGDTDIYDTFIDAVMIFRATFDPERSSAGAWLLLLTHQQAVNRLRGRREEVASLNAMELEPQSLLVGPDSQAEHQERLEQLRESLGELSELERTVVEADLDAGEAANARVLAEQLGTTERSIYAARTRARRKLTASMRSD